MTAVNPAGSASVPSSRDSLGLLTQGNAAPNRNTSGGSVSAPSAADHHAALSIFVNAAKVSFQGKGISPKARDFFKDALAASWQNLPQGQATALRMIAADFWARTDARSSTDCHSTIRTFLETVPGGLPGRLYNPNNGKFGV
jgi:hypothetical protein